jgi:hypothetical protein
MPFLVPVIVSNPKGRQTPRHLNAIFIEESESESIAILDKTNTQFQRMAYEPGTWLPDFNRLQKILHQLVSFTSYPKYPVLVLDYIQEEEVNSELKQLKNKLLTKIRNLMQLRSIND